MTTYSDHEQRKLDQWFSADMDRRAEALKRMEAHSRLVASAPALLTALKDLLAAIGGEESTDIWCKAARAAIARAEGGQP